jgi:hypothetical protein
MNDIWLLKHGTPSVAVAHALALMRALAPDVQTWHALDGSGCYSFTRGDAPTVPDRALAGTWQRLRCLQELSGASFGQAVSNHYIVETDVLPEYEDDLNAWYAQEHLPGLAGVPGTVRGARYVDDAGSPKYYACYDLTHADVLGSPAWLAVRATPWSSRVRPAFRNTQRTMFQRAMPEPG